MEDARQADSLLERLEAGDVTAFGELYGGFQTEVFAFAFSIVRNKSVAEDVVSEAFLKLYQYVSAGNRIGNLKALLFRISRNAAMDALRVRGRYAPLDDRISQESPNPHSDINIVVQEALGRLDSDEREIVTLYCACGLKHREIADILALPEGTVRWKYRKSVGRLKLLIGDDCNE